MSRIGTGKGEGVPMEEATVWLRLRTTRANARRLPSQLTVPDEFSKGVVSLLIDIADSAADVDETAGHPQPQSP